MTEVEELIQKLYDENGIETIERPLVGETKAACLSFSLNCKCQTLSSKSYIIVDRDKIEDDKHLFFEIAHEEMYLKNPETMYKLNDSYSSVIREKEYKCKMLMARKYVPKKVLFNLLYIEKLQLFEIAERLCITEELIEEAYNYYSCLEWWINKKAEFMEEN